MWIKKWSKLYLETHDLNEIDKDQKISLRIEYSQLKLLHILDKLIDKVIDKPSDHKELKEVSKILQKLLPIGINLIIKDKASPEEISTFDTIEEIITSESFQTEVLNFILDKYLEKY